MGGELKLSLALLIILLDGFFSLLKCQSIKGNYFQYPKNPFLFFSESRLPDSLGSHHQGGTERLPDPDILPRRPRAGGTSHL